MKYLLATCWLTTAALLLSACAIDPRGVADPIGVQAAISRCMNSGDNLTPGWMAMFGPALACR